jgi:hypothetical protein
VSPPPRCILKQRRQLRCKSSKGSEKDFCSAAREESPSFVANLPTVSTAMIRSVSSKAALVSKSPKTFLGMKMMTNVELAACPTASGPTDG